MISILNSYVFVCPNFGEIFKTLEDYLQYSEGQHDYWISDNLGCSYYFDSIESYQQWVRDELIAKGKTLYDFKFEEQNKANGSNKKLETVRVQVGRQQLIRLASEKFRTFSRKAMFARELALCH